MIKEAYCSYEVARLLEEKGFDEVVHAYHNIYDKVNLDFNVSVDAPHLQIPCPTHQMAMAWLREKYNINIDVVSIWEQKRWEYQIYIITPTTSKHPYRIDILYTAYEEAVEAALKYCLEKLI